MASAPAKLAGFLTRVERNKKNIFARHKLDTEIDKYYKTINNVVIPDCMEFVKEVPGLPQRMKECIAHSTPSFFDGWNFSVELFYKIVADDSHKTERNMEKARILRAITDTSYAMAAIVDDYADNNTFRRNKKNWASICEGGQKAAIYDTMVVNHFIFDLLKRHFRNDPGYSKLLEITAMINYGPAMGNMIDILERTNKNHTYIWKDLVYHKAMKVVGASGALGMVHAGIIRDDLIYHTLNASEYFGLLFQVWDDFAEHYAVLQQSGKEANDTELNVKSWATMTAMDHFNDAQTKEFVACYGSKDPAKKARIRELYDEVNLPALYKARLWEIYQTTEKKVARIANSRIRTASMSYLDWLVLDAPFDEKLDRIETF